MNVFEFKSDINTFDWLLMPRERDADALDLFDASGPIANWTPVTVFGGNEHTHYYKDGRAIARKKVRPYKERPVSETDFPYLGAGVPCFSGRAWDLLRPLIAEHAQALPLICDDGEFWAINVLTTLPETFDWDRAEYKRLQTTQRYVWLDRVVLRSSRRSWPPIFKLGEPVDTVRTYVSEEFKRAVEAFRLVGARFLPVEVSQAPGDPLAARE